MSQGFAISRKQIESLLIQRLRIEHPDALTISVDWDMNSPKSMAILWWVPGSPPTTSERDSDTQRKA